MRSLLFISLFISISSAVFAQDQFKEFENDTIKKLAPVVLIAKQQSPERLPETKENVLFSGKKNEVLKLSNINANLTNNNAREVFSRIPGVTVWENEGSGIQINFCLDLDL